MNLSPELGSAWSSVIFLPRDACSAQRGIAIMSSTCLSIYLSVRDIDVTCAYVLD